MELEYSKNEPKEIKKLYIVLELNLTNGSGREVVEEA